MVPVVRTFRVGRCLGRGGFGEVYRTMMVSPSGLSTEVALKVLRADVQLDPLAVARLRDEGQLLGRIRHPVVVGAYDLTRVDGRIGLITEFVDGDDLDRCFRDPGRIPARALIAAMGQVAGALDAAWSTPGPDGAPMAIVHRDLKPPNVRIGRHGQVKLLDFGIARFRTSDDPDRSTSDLVIASVPYMAPERFVERASLASGDVFGLGCCLYEGLVRERFHPDGTLRAVTALALDPAAFERHRDRRLSLVRGPPEIVDLLAACLSSDPVLRPPASEVARACETAVEGMEGPSLRRFCAERPWVDPPPVAGTLEGRSLVEGELGLPTIERPSAAPLRPQRLQAAWPTIDPEATGLPADGPHPALPIGVLLLADEPRIVSTDSIDRRRALAIGAIVPPRPEAPRPSWVRWAGLAGCGLVAAVLTFGLAGGALLGWLAVR